MNALAWLALGLGAASAWVPCPALAWRVAWAAMVAHVLLAFGTVHGWSHQAAMEATARQVEAVAGWRSGSGLWANYAFLVAWLAAALAWPRLGRPWRRVWWAAFLFMGFNATVVFVPWPMRWAGLAWAGLGAAGMLRAWNAGPWDGPPRAERVRWEEGNVEAGASGGRGAGQASRKVGTAGGR